MLNLAAHEDRILVTQDIGTMPQHFAEFQEAGNRRPGVLMIPQNVPTAEAIGALMLVRTASDPEEWVNRIASFPFRRMAGRPQP